jgi:hypothetical protein
MNLRQIKLSSIITACILLSFNLIFAQDSEIEYTRVFSSENIVQWEISGLVTPDASDGTLSFVFPYDDDAVLDGVPDTVHLKVLDGIDLSRCSTAYIHYDQDSNLPNEESWIITNIFMYARHEYDHNWVRVYENISHLAGWIHEMELQLKIVVKTDQAYPSTLILSDIRVEGACGS